MTHATRQPIVRARHALAAALLGLTACGADAPTATETRVGGSVAVERGADFTITLQTIGPGEYASPPDVSSPAVHFLDVRQADVAVPAGPTQLFRFHADAAGLALIAFHHTGGGAAVTDTVVVR